MSAELRQCPSCDVWTSNADHQCIVYDGPPCHCGSGTVYAFAGAPGTGGARICANGHYTDNTIRELTPGEVV